MIKRIPLHPQIHQFYEEYSFNKSKCLVVTETIEKLKAELYEKYGEKPSEPEKKKEEKVQETQQEQEGEKTEEKPKDLPEISVTSEESAEIEKLVQQSTEKEQIKVKPLPGIVDFSPCRSETIKRLEEQKRTLDIYKELRGLRKRYRSSVIEAKKKISEHEKRKSDLQKKEEQVVEKKEVVPEDKKERVEEMDQRLNDFMGETIEGKKQDVKTQEKEVVTEQNPSNTEQTVQTEEKVVQQEVPQIVTETPTQNNDDDLVSQIETHVQQKSPRKETTPITSAPIEFKKEVQKVDDDFFGSESLDKLPPAKKNIENDIDDLFN